MAADVISQVRGKTVVPAMDYESTQFKSSDSPLFIGNGNPTTLHVITVLSTGQTWQVELWKRTSSTTSVSIGIINPMTQGTFGFSAFGAAGWFFNNIAGTNGQAVVVFREQ